MHPVWRVHKLTASLETICPHRAIRDSRTTSKDAADLDCLTACMYECECVCVCVCVSWSHMTQEYADHFYGLRLSWCISARVEPVPPECGRCGLQANECTLGGEQIHRTNWQAGRMHAHIQVCHMSPWRLRSKRYRHTHSHAHTNWKCKNGSEQVWKAKAAQMMKKRKQPQANAAPEFASINKPRHTHTHTQLDWSVCVHVLANAAAALVVQIYYEYRLSMDVQHHTHAAKYWVNNTLKNDCLYPQHFTPINYELSTLHLDAHTHTRTHTHTHVRAHTHKEPRASR